MRIMTARPCPTRCFLADLPRQIPSKRLFRLLGTVVAIHQDEAHAQLASISMDDGTATVSVIAPHRMISQISLQVGNTAECVVRLEENDADGDHILFVDQLVRVQDPHAESLRWLELTHRHQHPDDDVSLGYPRQSITTDDIFQIIAAEQMMGTTEGAMLEDLAIVLDIPMPKLSEMIEELQMSGQIYRNEAGGFLPL